MEPTKVRSCTGNEEFVSSSVLHRWPEKMYKDWEEGDGGLCLASNYEKRQNRICMHARASTVSIWHSAPSRIYASLGALKWIENFTGPPSATPANVVSNFRRCGFRALSFVPVFPHTSAHLIDPVAPRPILFCETIHSFFPRTEFAFNIEVEYNFKREPNGMLNENYISMAKYRFAESC